MKNYLIAMLVVGATISTMAQTSTKLSKTQQVNFSNTDSGLNTAALKAAKDLDCCWTDTCKCSDLKDPWEAKSLSFDKQMDAVIKDKRATNTQKSLAAFEKAILDGKGKKRLNAKHLKAAFDKHPGYSKDAMSKRFDIYILSLESETEDE